MRTWPALGLGEQLGSENKLTNEFIVIFTAALKDCRTVRLLVCRQHRTQDGLEQWRLIGTRCLEGTLPQTS